MTLQTNHRSTCAKYVHHTGGYLKIAPEALSEGPLAAMMKPGMGTYYRFKELFDRYSKRARSST